MLVAGIIAGFLIAALGLQTLTSSPKPDGKPISKPPAPEQ